MPWTKVSGSRVSDCSEGQTAVVKEGENGEPDLSEVEGCHDSEEAADDQIAALESEEMGAADSVVMVPRLSGPTSKTSTDMPVRRPVALSDSGGQEGGSQVPDRVATLREQREGELLFQAGTGTTHQPTDAELAKINQVSTRDLTKDEVVVFEDLAASNEQMPHRPLRLTKSALKRLRDRYRLGRQFRAMHNEEERVGATFDASVGEETVNGETAFWLRVKSYAVLNEDTTPERRQLIQDMQTGVLGHTSIHATGGTWDTVELGEDADRPFIIEIKDNPDADADRLEAKELSRVDLGAVGDAQALQ